MAISLSYQPVPRLQPSKVIRRTATAVMAGLVDSRPPRDVLTSVLNGVPPYKAVENEAEERRLRKEQKRERDRERKRQRRAEEKVARLSRPSDILGVVTDVKAGASSCPVFSTPAAVPFPCYSDRPTIDIKDYYRSQSITPPPMSPLDHADFTPGSTPGPSSSSTTSRTSSKRPRTPDDDEELLGSIPEEREPSPPRPRKKRPAARKGWKGWTEVEGSPEPSEKLISLDIPPVLQERRTRSGKNFDAIGVGKDSWVNC